MKILPLNFKLQPNAKFIYQNRNNYTGINNIDLKNDEISFSGRSYITKGVKEPDFKIRKTAQTKDLRKVPGIICGCCGQPTINVSEIDKFIEEKLRYKGKEAIDILKKAGYFKGRMSVEQRRAYMFCNMCVNLYPEFTLERILGKEAIKEKINQYDDITVKEIYKIKDMTLNLFRNSEYMINELRPYKSIMHEIELEVFELLEKESKKHPQMTFTEILNLTRIKDKNLKKLEERQNKIFDEVLEIAKTLSPISQKKIENTVESSKLIFNQVVPMDLGKRSIVLEMFKNLTLTIPEKEEFDKILYKIYSLPSSRNNASAFVIKHANKSPNTIAKTLLYSSAATIEHVKPRNRKNDNGADNITNYIILCGKCNSERDQIPYSEFIKFHPDMPLNLQKYIDIVIENINNGTLVGYDDYPIEISKSVDTEANTHNLLNINKINLIQAKINGKKKAQKRRK